MLVLAAGLAACGLSRPVAAEPPAAPAASDPAPATEAPAPGPADQARWLVTFKLPPVATRFAGGADTGTEGSREDRMRAYAESLRQARLPSLQALRLQGWVVLATSEYSANTVTIEGPARGTPGELEALRQLPGVVGVQPVGLYRADGSAAAPAARPASSPAAPPGALPSPAR